MYRYFSCLLLSLFITLPCVAHNTLEADSLCQDAVADSLYRAQLDSLRKVQLDSLMAPTLRRRIDSVLTAHASLTDRTDIAIYVYDLTADSAIYARGHHKQMRPASTEKVLTAVTALQHVGSKAKFTTTLALADSNLVVRGGMDPSFDEHDMRRFVKAVRNALQTDTLRGELILDLSFKDSVRLGWGWCWDDDDVPLTPLTYRDKDNFGETFRAMLLKEGIVILGPTRKCYKHYKHEGQTLCTVTSSMDEILLRMMKRSDNQYAESMFYLLGSTAKEARHRVTKFISSLGLSTGGIQVADGSGLSLYNYTTPEILVHTLRYAYTHKEIYSHLLPALPNAGEEGSTLRHRMKKGPAHGRIFAKTGTLEGVSNLAGYALGPNGHMLAFAIMNQGQRQRESARDFQDEICQELCREME